MIDLLIAGAGPAGLATALYAVRAGLEVEVVDPRLGTIDGLADQQVPMKAIDKACGEGLMPGALAALRRLGVDPVGREFRGIEYRGAGHIAQALFRAGPGLGARRTELQAAMLAAVRTAGVRMTAAAVSDVDQDDSGVQTSVGRARYLVAADGLHSPIARSLALDRAVRAKPRWGLRRHYSVEPWSDFVQVHWAEGAEAYVTPVGPQLVGVAILSGDRLPFDTQLSNFPALTERLGGLAGGQVRGAGPLRRRTARRVAGRVLLVGDAAGYVDALTGEGIAVSMACSRALVECVAAGRPGDYESRWLAESRRYRALTSALLWASRRPAIRRNLVPAAERIPWLFTRAVAQLAR
jgi:flavin-dependent dehydrogenase